MDEHTNDSNTPPEVISPDKPNDEPSSSVEAEAEETPKEVSGAPSVPDSGISASEGTNKPNEEPKMNDSSDTASSESRETPPESQDTSHTSEAAVTESSAPSTPSPTSATSAPAPSIPAYNNDSSSAGTPPKPAADKPKNKMVTVVLVVIAVVLLAAAAIVWALHNNKKTSPPATSTSTTTSQPKINIWTGKANTYDWGTAANWSLGVPTSGESLAINVSSVKQPNGNAIAAFNNNVPNLTISKLIIDGTGTGFAVKGNPLTITGSIASDITAAKNSSNAPLIDLEIAITFAGNQTVQAAANNDLRFNAGASSATTTIGANTVQYSAAKSGDIEVFTPIVGTGEIEVPASTSTTGNVDFNTASPNFTGKVLVNDGATIGMSNQNASGNGVSSSTDAFGTAAITIASGGYLELNETGSNSFTVPNDIAVGGNGGISPSKDNGDNTGAISTCITKAQQGCDVGATVTFTGKLTLTSNTTFGAFYGNGTAQVPPSTAVTYNVQNVTTNSHTLTAVTNSKAVVQLPKS